MQKVKHILRLILAIWTHCEKNFCLSVCLCVCVCVCVCMCVYVSVCPEFLWTKFQPNGCTDLDAVFAKWLLTALARTLLKLVTLGQRSRSLWPKMYAKMMKKIRQKFISRHFFKSNLIIRLEILSPSFWYQTWPYCKINNPKKISMKK